MEHPDTRVRLEDTSYFFLGNGHVRAAVQFTAERGASPLGLVVESPALPGAKRDALSMRPADGLAPVGVRVRVDGVDFRPSLPNLSVKWMADAEVPTVVAFWGTSDFSVRERFYCPDASTPRLAREVGVANHHAGPRRFTIIAGSDAAPLRHDLDVPPGGLACTWLIFELGTKTPSLMMRYDGQEPLTPEAVEARAEGTSVRLGLPFLDHLWWTSAWQLPAVVSHAGVMASRVWGTADAFPDQTSVAVALGLLGNWRTAAALLGRLTTEAVVRSQEARPEAAMVSGSLLQAWHRFFLLSGDRGALEAQREQLLLLAERSSAAKASKDLPSQVYACVGLAAAAGLAAALGAAHAAERWSAEEAALRAVVTATPSHSLLPLACGVASPRSTSSGTLLEWLGQNRDEQHVRPVEVLAEARVRVDSGGLEKVSLMLDWLGTLAGAQAGMWFDVYDIAPGGANVEAPVAPLAWAELIHLIVRHVIGLRVEANGIHVQPRLLPGMTCAEARIRIREGTLRLTLAGDARAAPDVEHVLPYPTGDVTLVLPARTTT